MLSVLLIASFVLCMVFLGQSNQFFQEKVSDSQVEIDSYQPVVSKAHKLEEDVGSIQKIKNNYQYWSKFNAYLGATVPQGIYLDRIEENEGALKITGYAKTKSDVGIFRDALEKTGAFSNVNISSVSGASDQVSGAPVNNFVMDMTMTKDATDKGASQ